MPMLDARALKADPEGMALLADVLRPAKPGVRRKAAGRPPLSRHDVPATGRERLEDEPAAPLVLAGAD